ncbi:AAA-ATPase ASD, mitochondrial-like [Typha angustifolia]|uniref:AAA-ATPase ASD, mitochondrial-like n=1 Tax=Typha angustifolia TaxID=59011 RepID=UPI003C2EAE77
MERLAGFGSAIASFMFLFAMVKQYFPYQLQAYFTTYTTKIVSFVYPYIQITVPEYGERMKRSEAFSAVEAYLSSSCSKRARKLKADIGKDSSKVLVTMDDHEEVVDEFEGAKIWWYASKTTPKTNTISWYPGGDERRFYRLSFHKRQRDLIINSYLSHVLKEGRTFRIQNRQRKLFTNNPSSNWHGYKKSTWSHVVFEHPSTFDTLAMHPDRKKDLIDDLTAFRNGKDYYAKIGKAWKRGYLLFGPPGTGKSTMIAAIANFLDYDVYDLELTSVKNNTELRKLFIDTTGKSIIVVEDIDCSLDLTGKRKSKKKTDSDEDAEEKKKLPPGMDDKEENSKVTLSGLLNFIDGLWSACGGERIIVFTTNHIEKLDPALIRKGRMDKHIEMSYCGFEAFKVLAKNYLDVEDHHLFDAIKTQLEEVSITPADVAENLMPKSEEERKNPGICFGNLIKDLELAKEAAAKAEVSNKEESSSVEDSP